MGWVVGFGFLILVDIYFFFKAYRLSKTWLTNTEPELDSLVNQVRVNLKVQRNFEVLLTNERTSPFVFGLLQIKLVIPRSLLQSLGYEEIKSILSHELIHIKDLDSLWSLLEFSLRRVFFFLPLGFIFKKMFYEVQEMAADEKALLGSQVAPAQYARHFLKLIEFYSNPVASYGRTQAISNYKSLKARLLALEAYPEVKVSLMEKMIMTSAVLGSFVCCAAEARNSIVAKNESGAMMCMQMEHEIVLQKILHVESPKVRCE